MIELDAWRDSLAVYCAAFPWPEFAITALLAFFLGFALGRWDRRRSIGDHA